MSEARSAAGSGTMLQEYYVTPALMGDFEWDALAEAAKWVRCSFLNRIDVAREECD
jgi:hypothetical protein